MTKPITSSIYTPLIQDKAVLNREFFSRLSEIENNIEELSKYIDKNIEDFSSENIAYSLYLCEKHRDIEKINFIKDNNMVPFCDFSPQDLTITARVFASAGIKDDKLFDKLAEESLKKLEKFNSEELSSIVYAFAIVDRMHFPLFNEVAKIAPFKIRNGEFSNTELSWITWVFASVGIIDKQLFESIADAVVDNFGNFNRKDLDSIILSFEGVGREDLVHLLKIQEQ